MTLREPNVDLALSREHGLTDEEWGHILQILGRTPSFSELGIFSVMWAEHCSYKSSKKYLKQLPTKAAHVLHGPGENAGVKHNVGTDSPVVGTWFFGVQDEADILASRTYFNVHTEANGGGEIRGQIGFSGRPCPIDISCSGEVDFDDLLLVLAAWGEDGGPADIDGNGVVNFNDLLLLLGAWGPCGDPCPADLDGDGFVGFPDILILLAAWT